MATVSQLRQLLGSSEAALTDEQLMELQAQLQEISTLIADAYANTRPARRQQARCEAESRGSNEG